jgi:hypothetical protein
VQSLGSDVICPDIWAWLFSLCGHVAVMLDEYEMTRISVHDYLVCVATWQWCRMIIRWLRYLSILFSLCSHLAVMSCPDICAWLFSLCSHLAAMSWPDNCAWLFSLCSHLAVMSCPHIWGWLFNAFNLHTERTCYLYSVLLRDVSQYPDASDRLAPTNTRVSPPSSLVACHYLRPSQVTRGCMGLYGQ